MKKRRTKPSQCFASHLGWILFQAAPVKNVWPPSCLFSALHSSLLVLHSDLEVSGDTNPCRRYACFSPTSVSNIVSVETLVQRSTGLLDLFRRRCLVHTHLTHVRNKMYKRISIMKLYNKSICFGNAVSEILWCIVALRY